MLSKRGIKTHYKCCKNAKTILPNLIKLDVCIQRKTDPWVLSMCEVSPPICICTCPTRREDDHVSEEFPVPHGAATTDEAKKRLDLLSLWI